MKKTLNIITNIIFVFILILAGTLLISRYTPKIGYYIFVIKTGSMEPTIKPGNLVISHREPNYKEGDVITFSKTVDTIVTHRVISVQEENGTVTGYKTKGDANNNEDAEPIEAGVVFGKMKYNIPYVGYAIMYAKNKTGILFLIVLPAVLIIINEIWKIKKNLAEMKAKKESGGYQAQ